MFSFLETSFYDVFDPDIIVYQFRVFCNYQPPLYLLIFYERPLVHPCPNRIFGALPSYISILYSQEAVMTRQTISGILLAASFLSWTIYSTSFRPLLALLAVLLHEGGHWLATKLCRIPLNGFTLDSCEARLLLGGTRSYKKEIFICLAGPAVNLLSLLISFVMDAPLLGQTDVSFFVTVSVALAGLNLLPIGDLDGGRILSCLLCLLTTPRLAAFMCNTLSFLSLFYLWAVSVYALLRTGGSLSLFLFSGTLFFRVFMSVPTREIGSIPKNKRE